jgi:hypothetical protein
MVHVDWGDSVDCIYWVVNRWIGMKIFSFMAGVGIATGLISLGIGIYYHFAPEYANWGIGIAIGLFTILVTILNEII